MKKILFAAASASFLLIACNNGATNGTSSAKDSTIERNLASNKKVYKAFETGNKAVLDSFISSDAVDHAGPNGTTMSGDSIKNMLADMHNHVKDLNVNIITAAANEDYIFTYTEFTGTAADSTWGMPAGTKIDEKSVDLVRVKDGKMVEHWAFADPNEMMKRMQEMHSNDKMKAAKDK
jgi:predicted ester cyclase